MKSFELRAVLTGIVITGTLLFASPAWATFPGANGRIAFAALPTPTRRTLIAELPFAPRFIDWGTHP